MTAITFDTLAFANKLKNAGVEPKAAETQAEAISEILSELTTNQLATKSDLKALEISTKNDLKNELNKLEIRMYKSIGGMIFFAVTILGGLQTLFHFIK